MGKYHTDMSVKVYKPGYMCSCLSGITFTSSPRHPVMVGKYHTDISKVYKSGI